MKCQGHVFCTINCRSNKVRSLIEIAETPLTDNMPSATHYGGLQHNDVRESKAQDRLGGKEG